MALEIAYNFGGSTYDKREDGARLSRQFDRVRALMQDARKAEREKANATVL